MTIRLRPNVPEKMHPIARKTLAGYYAHIAALEYCLGELLDTLRRLGMEEDILLIFTSDHGDMLYSQGRTMKQKPWYESILVHLLARYPKVLDQGRRTVPTPINTPDILLTMLNLCGLPVPSSVEGTDFSGLMSGKGKPDEEAALLCCPVPFHPWNYQNGGREYRGIRTER